MRKPMIPVQSPSLIPVQRPSLDPIALATIRHWNCSEQTAIVGLPSHSSSRAAWSAIAMSPGQPAHSGAPARVPAQPRPIATPLSRILLMPAGVAP